MVAETQGIGWALPFREPGIRACTPIAYKRDARKPMLETAEQLADMLEAVARRDRSAFETVYLATSTKLYGLILRILGRREIADEVLQEVYLLVWQHAASFDRRKASPVTWLATIARNRALDEKKRRQIVASHDLDTVSNLATTDDDPLVDATRNSELYRILDCMEHLDPEHRRALLLAFDQGLTREEIAQCLDRPSGTIKTWLRRSLMKLKECLSR